MKNVSLLKKKKVGGLMDHEVKISQLLPPLGVHLVVMMAYRVCNGMKLIGYLSLRMFGLLQMS